MGPRGLFVAELSGTLLGEKPRQITSKLQLDMNQFTVRRGKWFFITQKSPSERP